MLTALVIGLPWILFVIFLASIVFHKWASYRKGEIDPTKKWIFVTGAASGIGQTTALAILSQGGCVWATDINEKALKQTFLEFGPDRVKIHKLDVRDAQACKDLARLVQKETPKLFGIINSAGVGAPPGTTRTVILGAAELDVDRDARPVVDINVFGTMNVNSALFDLIWTNRSASPVICNLSSVAGRIAAPGMSVYAATKHAVSAYSSSMRRELAPYGIRVFSIEPGFTKTPLLANSVDCENGLDFSQTRLKESFAFMMDNAKLTNRLGGTQMQSATPVAEHILTALYSTAFVPPHMICDENQYWFHQLSSNMPHHWVDAAINLVRRFA